MNRVLAWATARRAAGRAGWRGTDALFRGAVGGVGLVATGVVLHHVDLVFIGAPLLLGTVFALGAPVGRSPAVRAERVSNIVTAGDRGRLTVTVVASPGVEFLAVRMPLPPGNGTRSPGPVHLLPGSTREIRAAVQWNAWGEGLDIRPDHLAAGRDGLLIHGPIVGAESRRTVLPPVLPLEPGPLPPRAAGLVGAHRSPRAGDGTELRTVRPFRPGDRLRRIDWRVTLRAGAATGDPLGTPHVRERHAEADADLLLALDSRADPTATLADWSLSEPGIATRPGGSLDIAVRAVAALAAACLRQGDRVGLVDLGRPHLGLPPGVGHRQLLRIRHQLVACCRTAGWAPRPLLPTRRLPRGAVVVLLSPFLDDDITDLTIRTARGHLVIAVDTLPTPLTADPDEPWGEVVRHILTTEHQNRLNALRTNGITVVPTPDEIAPTLRRLRHRR
ncbi:DUF58 domain-containing protein [Actinokineospora enzanensis]|uniref:DUF58 domain-containing protein n=1 Tax=Actinokineospora enzanensis TaxID=155975 RepID=UPI000376B2A0|nr:DUF58 domain-containing protein [Actinokineospora enzanensis]